MFQVGLSVSGSQFPRGSRLESTLGFLFYDCFHMTAYIPCLIRRMKRREAGREGKRERKEEGKGVMGRTSGSRRMENVLWLIL